MIPPQFQKAIAAHERMVAEAQAAREALPHVVEFVMPITGPMAMAMKAGRPATTIRAIKVLLEAPQEWCAETCKGAFHMSELPVTRDNSLVYDFRFADDADAALFKVWWS